MLEDCKLLEGNLKKPKIVHQMIQYEITHGDKDKHEYDGHRGL